MDRTLKSHKSVIDKHDELLDEHNDEICHIRRDLVDIKTRLGIKDLTNGQVQKYQEELIKSVVEEKMERKEQDNLLRESLKSLDDKIWFIVTGIILMVLLEIGLFILQSHL